MEGRIAGSEVAVQNKIVFHRPGKVQPVLWHAVCQSVQVPLLQPGFLPGGLLRAAEKRAVCHNLLQHAADRSAEGVNLLGGEHIRHAAGNDDDPPVPDVIAADRVGILDLVAVLVTDDLFRSLCGHLQIGILRSHVCGEIMDQRDGVIRPVSPDHDIVDLALAPGIDIVLVFLKHCGGTARDADPEIPVCQGGFVSLRCKAERSLQQAEQEKKTPCEAAPAHHLPWTSVL